MIREFWKDWRNVSELERKAIETVHFGTKLILSNLPRKGINSIYLKGSFVRREMQDKSDVDFVVIVKESKYVDKIAKIENEYKDADGHSMNITGYSLWELRTGKMVKTPSMTGIGRIGPRRMQSHFNNYKLIFGKNIDASEIKGRPPIKDLMIIINLLEDNLIPSFEKKKAAFQTLVKQTFWLTYDELRMKCVNPPSTWREMDESIRDKSHIVHDAWKYRQNHTKDERIRENYVEKLKNYIRWLKEKYK